MKKIITISLLFVCAFCFQSKAQFNSFTLSKISTTAGIDTITGNITYPASIAMTAVVRMSTLSGTTGKLVLFGTNLGTTYTRLDSISVSGIVTSTAGPTEYTFNHFTNSKFDKPDFWKYRFVWYQTAQSVSAASGVVLTRTGGN